MGGNKTGSIPAGWLNCPNAGAVIDETFFAFKTPLNSAFDCRLSKNHRWNPDSVLRYTKENKIRMGLWIDLTNTERYFHKSEVEKFGIEYLKLKIGGGGEVPSSFAVKEFVFRCQTFLDKHPGCVIGVHCTHGFNRTGYLICSFLARVKRKLIHEVVAEFSIARPPGIYRQTYVAALWKIFPAPCLPTIPKVLEPPWSQRHGIHNEMKNTTKSTPSSAHVSGKLKRRHEDITSQETFPSIPPPRRALNGEQIKYPQFFGNVPGIEYVDNPWLREQVLKDARRMCLECSGLRLHPEMERSYLQKFPGRRRKEIQTKDLQFLNSEYIVTWTSDTSIKYLLLIKTAGQVFFIDTACSVFQARGMTFLDRKDFKKKHLNDTLLDGEAMMSKYKDTLVPRFFVHDIIYFYGKPVTELSHIDRISLVKKEILDPRMTFLKNGIILRRKESPLWIVAQTFWPSCKYADLLQPGFLEEVPVGLQFIHGFEPYNIHSTGRTFSWKRNKYINFQIEVNFRKRIVDLFVLELLSPFASVPFDSVLERSNGRICRFTFTEDKRWCFVKETNAQVPGSYDDAMTVISMEEVEPVTEATLLSAIRRIV